MPAKLGKHVKVNLAILQLITLVYPIKEDALSLEFKCDEALICECHCQSGYEDSLLLSCNLHLRIFYCISYVHVDLDHRSKLDPSPRGASSLGTIQANTTIGFEIQKIKRSLVIRM